MSTLDSIKETLVDSTISDLEEVIKYCVDQIELQQDVKLEKIDQEMAELQARRDAIRPPQRHKRHNGSRNSTRNYKEIVNPNDPSQVYKTGPHPIWLTQMLKDELGDKYGDKAEMARVIAQWKNGGTQ